VCSEPIGFFSDQGILQIGSDRGGFGPFRKGQGGKGGGKRKSLVLISFLFFIIIIFGLFFLDLGAFRRIFPQMR
jgi:hypothetical protein